MEGSGRSTVVLRYRDGHALRCFLTTEFNPSDHAIDAATEDGDPVRVEVEQLKAVFFLKDPLRREFEVQLGQPSETAPSGAPARVEFFDGEIVHGLMESYAVDDQGFFLYPSSLESNNERIFVVAQALRTLSIEG